MFTRILLLAAIGGWLPLVAVLADEEKPKPEPSHVQARKIAVQGEHSGNRLQTLCVSTSGEIIALVGLSRYGSAERDVPSEVQVFSPEGEKQRSWKVAFAAQTINVDAKGHIFVAGSGKLAEFSPTGSPLAEIDLPHVAEVLKDAEGLRQRAEEQLKAEKQSYQAMVDQYVKAKDELEKKDKEKLTAQEKAQLQMYAAQLKAFENSKKFYESRTVDEVVKDLTARVRTVNAVTATDRDVFIATGESKGYGYAIWRMTRDYKEPKQILKNIGGCCGQMDIQARGNELYVAENTRHQVGRYDRDGKRLGSFGKRGRDGDPECFGSCCNPMNCCIAKDGSVYTAESEGHIKHFSADGKFLGPVGSAKISGGCKNVGIGVSPDGETVYFCDQPGSAIIILSRKTDAGSGN
jgi:hypothetical protein